MLPLDASAPPGYTELRYHVEIESPDARRARCVRSSTRATGSARCSTCSPGPPRCADHRDRFERAARRLRWNRSSSAGSSARAGTAPSDCYERYWQRQLQPAIDGVLERGRPATGRGRVDVACGTGMVTLPAAAASAPGGRVLATDLSPKMIDEVAATGCVSAG